LTCSCGRNYQKIDFASHLKTQIINSEGDVFFDLDIPNHLEDQYINLQFIQEGNQILVLYVNKDLVVMKSADKDLIAFLLVEAGFRNFCFQTNSFMFTSMREKTNAFYRNVADREIQQFPDSWKPGHRGSYFLF
jgi:hypothetical protein